MAGRHLKPINRRGRKRRMLKSLPSLSCEYPSFDYDLLEPEKTIDAKAEKKQKEKAAA